MAFLDETGLGKYTLNVKGMISRIQDIITSHTTDYGNPHGVTKSHIGLENVENKSSETIRSEITSDDIVNALGYNPSDATNYDPAGEDFGVIKSGGDLTIIDGIATVNDNSHEHAVENINGIQTVLDNTVSVHNTSVSSHNDIRLLISDLSTRVDNFLDVDDSTKDQLSEVITLIENNKGTLESLTTSKINVSDIIDNLTTNNSSKVLSAKQGVVIKNLIDALQIELDDHTHEISDVSGLQNTLDKKALASDLTSHTSNTTAHIATSERTNWNSAKTHADSTHAPSNAEKNIVVGIQKNGTDLTVDSDRKVNITVPTKVSELTNDSGFKTTDNDTKNTAGSTNSSSKLFLIGATSQAANPQTYSHDTVYVGTDGCLYSNNTRVTVEKISSTEPTEQVNGDYWVFEY